MDGMPFNQMIGAKTRHHREADFAFRNAGVYTCGKTARRWKSLGFTSIAHLPVCRLPNAQRWGSDCEWVRSLGNE